MFQPVDGNVKFPEQELAVGKFWKEHGIYEKSLAQRQGAEPFVFFEGPPTANGMPHPGHCLTRAIKDLFPRYQTMRGKLCQRKAGWDTHGLPVEVEVCKELGIHSKEEIEAYGIEKFIQLCQQSVWRYMQEWRRLTERLGFWVDLDDAYVTYHQSFVESVWWSLKNLFDRGLLYQGHKIVWWWAQGGTALSAGEVGQGYRQVADPSVYVKFPLLDDAGKVTDTSLLVWTTTPWTLPSNQFAAVHPELEYVRIIDRESNEKLIVVSALLDAVTSKASSTAKKKSGPANESGDEITPRFVVDVSFLGRDLVGKRYVPPFDFFYKHRDSDADSIWINTTGPIDESEKSPYWKEKLDWRIVDASFVSTDSGTGIVHIAPAFGEDDYGVLKEQQAKEIAIGYLPVLLLPVKSNGTFDDEFPGLGGRWVKDCDKDIIRDLKQRGLLFHQEQYVHDYPFCWRAEEDPLIQYPRESWFVRTTQFKDAMLANNAKINWLPEHIKEGRFGNFLESNVDWALSRERYWGTPLPIWKCSETGKMEAIGSYKELMTKPGFTGGQVWAAAKKANPALPDDLQVHKPYIDAVTYDSPFAKNAKMQRVTEVIDCWYDSGAMPFAQWGYPHAAGSAERFKSQFPADFISEAIDQTRGWFYSLLAISTLAFEDHPKPHPYRNCIVLGLMLGEGGQKMSKSKKNYLPPNEIFDKYGADALRWYFFANQPPWTSIRYSEQAIKDSIPEFLLRLWNVYSFFVIYANIDGFDPSAEGFGVQGSGFRNLDSESFSAAKSYRPVKDRSELDRWILSELNRTVAAVVERMDAYDNYAACGHITEFVDALSNWYVRRSRDRFWTADKRAVDKLDAYWTLYECLVTTAKLVAPFVPFVAETLWQNLAGVFQGDAAESVHLCDYPMALSHQSHHSPNNDVVASHDDLVEQMAIVREIASLGRNARNIHPNPDVRRVRQQVREVTIVLQANEHRDWIKSHLPILKEELNVLDVQIAEHASDFISYELIPNFKSLGSRLKHQLPLLKSRLGKLTEKERRTYRDELVAHGRVSIDLVPPGNQAVVFLGPSETPPENQDDVVQLTSEDLTIRVKVKDGWVSAEGKNAVVLLPIQISVEADEELLVEGLIRETIRFIQKRRKDLECDFLERVLVDIVVDSSQSESKDSDEVIESLNSLATRVKTETQADSLFVVDAASREGKDLLKSIGIETHWAGFSWRGHQIDMRIRKSTEV